MSFLPFEGLGEVSNHPNSFLDAAIADEEQHYSSDLIDPAEADIAENQDPSTTEEDNSSQRHDGGSSFASIGYQEPATGIRPGAFIEVYRERQEQQRQRAASEEDGSFSGTILSSMGSAAGTNDIYPPPLENSYDVWAISPHPNIVAENTLSISTADSVYRNVLSLNDSRAGLDDVSVADSFLSLRPSMMDTSIMDGGVISQDMSSITNPPGPQAGIKERNGENSADLHNQESIMNLASRLDADSKIPLDGEDKRAWFSHFTENDWLSFRDEAKMVLNALNPHSSDADSIVVPPSCPVPNQTNQELMYVAADHLPASFICTVCSDVVVGATTLSCACPQSTVCQQCWEAHSLMLVDKDDGESSFLVVQKNNSCPFCNKKVDQAVPCHAMDVAILHCIKSLPEGLPVQTAYYRRLKGWRDEVIRRTGASRAKGTEARDRLLAQLIQREEEIIWKQKKPGTSWRVKRGWEVAWIIVGAGLSLVALALSKRKH